jgi:hypothetical protein
MYLRSNARLYLQTDLETANTLCQVTDIPHLETILHDLIPLGPALPGALTVAEIDATMAYGAAEKALATRAAYASDWRDFAAWCAGKGATPLPAHVGIVAAYLSHLAEAGLKASTIGRRAAAIAYHHKIAVEAVQTWLAAAEISAGAVFRPVLKGQRVPHQCRRGGCLSAQDG